MILPSKMKNKNSNNLWEYNYYKYLEIEILSWCWLVNFVNDLGYSLTLLQGINDIRYVS